MYSKLLLKVFFFITPTYRTYISDSDTLGGLVWRVEVPRRGRLDLVWWKDLMEAESDLMFRGGLDRDLDLDLRREVDLMFRGGLGRDLDLIWGV